MTDDELRSLVRAAVARHLGGVQTAPDASLPGTAPPAPPRPWGDHPSHHLYLTLINASEACVIEPSVACTHCGFCKSHGH
jgi:hypothetical protein